MINNKLAIPSSWKWVTLNDIGIIVSGGTPSTKEPEFWNGSIPWITPADLSGYEDIFISKGKRNISQIGLEFSSATLLPENSVVFSSRAPIGYVAITQNQLATNQGFKNIILTSNLINSKYTFYYLKTIKEIAENMASGTTFLELSASKFKQIPFPLAPIQEQLQIVKKIDELFSELDKNLIELNKNLIDIDNLWEISLNKIITSKKSIPLNKHISIKGGKRLPKNTSYSSEKTNYAYIRVTDFSDFSIDQSNLKYIDKEIYEQLENYSINASDVYISIAGTIGLVGSIPYVLKNAILTENAAKLSFNDENISKEYLIYALHSHDVKNQIADSIKATSQPKLALYKIAELSIPDHSIENQNKIVEKLDEIRINCQKLKINVEESIINTIITKKKILQDAFQGKLTNRIDTEIRIESVLAQIEKNNIDYQKYQTSLLSKKAKIVKSKKNLLDVLIANFKNSLFSFDDIIKTNSMSIDEMEDGFKDLLQKGSIDKIYDDQCKTIKFKLV